MKIGIVVYLQLAAHLDLFNKFVKEVQGLGLIPQTQQLGDNSGVPGQTTGPVKKIYNIITVPYWSNTFSIKTHSWRRCSRAVGGSLRMSSQRR